MPRVILPMSAAAAALATVLPMVLGAIAAAQPAGPRTITIAAKRFDYTPDKLTLKKGETVVLALTSLDRIHGFTIPALGVRTDVMPGETVQVTVTPTETGTFEFHCDNFCGSGHEDMGGEIAVSD